MEEQRVNEAKLVAKAIGAIIKARNYGYKYCTDTIQLKISKTETLNYTYITIIGFEAPTIAINLKSIFSAIYSVQINSNDNVNISIFKNA